MTKSAHRTSLPHEAPLDAPTLLALYHRFAPLVHARAVRVVGSEADDIVQELFMRLIHAGPRPDATASYIYSMSTNLCIDRLRHASRRNESWHAELGRVAGDGAADLEKLLVDKDLCRRLLGGAPGAVQEAVVLYYFDEMTQDEVAESLGVSRKTVVERIARWKDYARKQVLRWRS